MNENRKQSDEFWKEIIYKDGKLDEEQILKELSDYLFILEQIGKVYCHVTGGKLSKPMYYAETIIAEADNYQDELFEELLKERKEEWELEQEERIKNEKVS